MNTNREIYNAFNTHATEYEQAAKIQREIGTRLFERLSYLKINPQFVLDLGCGTGWFTEKLRAYYPRARVIGFDLAYAMLKEAKRKQRWRKRWPLINGDMNNLPFPAGLFDLIFANQVLHWSDSLTALMNELNRVTNVNGCLMFSTLGPDTFQELRTAWKAGDRHAHANDFIDMHDVGDALMKERYIDPVVDMEKIEMHYKTLPELVRSLKAQGVRNVNNLRNKGLTGKASWSRFEQAFTDLKTENNKFPLTYEVVYGHAWKGVMRQTNNGSETFVPIDALRRIKK